MSEDTPVLLYPEREAVSVLRKAIARGKGPLVVQALMKDAPLAAAAEAMKQLLTTLRQQQEVVVAFKQAYQYLADKEKERVPDGH